MTYVYSLDFGSLLNIVAKSIPVRIIAIAIYVKSEVFKDAKSI